MTVQDTTTFPGILLAAGLSRRFGSQKLLIPYAGGLTIFEHTLRSHLMAGLDPFVVVVSRNILARFAGTGHKETPYRIVQPSYTPWLNMETPWGKARVMVNENPERGMSLSLKLGLQGLREGEKQEGVLVSLSDMPKIRPEIIRALVERYRKEGVDMVVPTFHDRIGHPVVFRESRYRAAIEDIQGDKGLRDLIQSKRGKILFVPWQDDAVIADVDTPTDLNKIFQKGIMTHEA